MEAANLATAPTASSGGNATPFHSTGPLLAWLAVQIGAIALAAGRIPLWPKAPQAGEFLAVEILLVVQILFAALLSPQLCLNWRTTLMAVAVAWPFAALAGFLAAGSVSTVLYSGGYVSGWILALWIWCLPFHSRAGRLTVSAVASTWAAGGPLLLFVGTEYGATPFHSTGIIARVMLGPIVDYLVQFGPNPLVSGFSGWRWTISVGVAFFGILALLLRRASSSRGFPRIAEKSRKDFE